jgi:hypothetical protein
MAKIDFERTAELALVNSRAILDEFLPGGKYQGSEYVALNPTRSDVHSGSFKINTVKGVWSDFAGDASGKDLVSLVAYLKGIGQAEAARILLEFMGMNQPEPRVVATFTYLDRQGKPLYFKERLEPGRDGRKKEFRFYHKEGRKRVSGRGREKVLYNLPALLKAKSVLFVEGEAKADLLKSWGLAATSLDSGSQSKLTKGMIQDLSGRRIVILPDNDDPGREYAAYLAATLHGKAESLKILSLPGLSEKEDVIQWAAVEGNDKENLLEFIRLADEYTPAAVESPPAAPLAKTMKRRKRGDDGEERPERVTQNEIMLNLMDGLPLLVDDTRTAWTFIDGKTIPVESQELADWLMLKYFRMLSKAPSSEALSAAVKVMAAKARVEGEMITLFNRVARVGDEFRYDLGNGRTVRIFAQGWEFVEPQPIFQRWPHQQPQPEPIKGGNPWNFFNYCHLPEDSVVLALTVLITSFVPGIAHPLLHVTGPQGSGKSSFCRLVKRLVDPSAAELQIMQPQKEQDFFLTLYQNYLLAFDNLSDLSGRVSDLLCGAATGITVSQRVLYSNVDLQLLRLKNIVLLNGITPLIHRADLLDRTVSINLGRIPPEKRREETEILSMFDRDLPGILGGAFDVLSRAMALYPTIKLDSLPRLADFARWGYCVAESLGSGLGDKFLADYLANGTMQNEEVLGQNTLASALVAEMEGKYTWETHVKTAWSTLLERAKPPHGDKTFPGKPQDLNRHLERLRVSLSDAGITFEKGKRDSQGVEIVFYRRDISCTSSGLSSLSCTAVTNRIAETNVDNVHNAHESGYSSTLCDVIDIFGGEIESEEPY